MNLTKLFLKRSKDEHKIEDLHLAKLRTRVSLFQKKSKTQNDYWIGIKSSLCTFYWYRYGANVLILARRNNGIWSACSNLGDQGFFWKKGKSSRPNKKNTFILRKSTTAHIYLHTFTPINAHARAHTHYPYEYLQETESKKLIRRVLRLKKLAQMPLYR
jgi:hypothetical protein